MRQPPSRRELLEEAATLTRALVGSLTRGFPPHVERDDIHAYCLLRVVSMVDRFDETRSSWSSFVYGHVYYGIRDYVREQRFGPRRGADHFSVCSLNTLVGDGMDDKPVEFGELFAVDDPELERDFVAVDRLHEAISRLSPNEQIAIGMTFFQEERQLAVAEFLGVSESRVSQMLATAYRKLAREPDLQPVAA